MVQLVETLVASQFQKDIYHWVEFGSGNAIIKAVAGSGKTTVLKHSCKIIFDKFGVQPLAIAFNKHIKDELSLKIGEYAQIQTFNSLGHRLVGNSLGRGYLKVDDDKYRNICKKVVIDRNGNNDWETNERFVQELLQLTNFCMKTLTGTKSREDLEEMISNYNLDIDSLNIIGNWLGLVIKEGDNLAREGVISFSDQLFLPHLWKLQPTQKYSWVLGDEMQDTSTAALELFLKFTDSNTRILAVADPKQAIMGFAGANSDAVDRLQSRTNAISLPLSICYRCPKSHIALAQKLVPEIQHSPTASEGEVLEIQMKCKPKGGYTYEELIPLIRGGELIICRKTAPLVSLCIKLITHRIPAKVRGRDIGASLGKLIDDISKTNGFKFDEFPKYADILYEARKAKFLVKQEYGKIESLLDRVQGLLACYEGFDNIDDVKSFKKAVSDLFSDTQSNVVLSTIHKAKGLEGDRIVFLHPEFCPMRWEGQNKEMFQQEKNLEYVALTRSKHLLIMAYGLPPKKSCKPPTNNIEDWVKEYEDSKEDFFKGCHTPQEIQDRYRNLAKQYHPDIPGGSTKLMQELNRQYELVC